MGGISIWQILIILIFVGAIYGIYRFAKNPPPAKSNTEGPAGVAGCLLLLVVGLMLLGPLMGAGRINVDIMLAESQYPNLKDVESWQLYKSATWWSFLVVVFLSFYAGFGLAKSRNPFVVKRAKILLWVTGPVASIVMGIFLPLFVFGELVSDPQFFGALIGSVLAAAIWTAYLSKSRRVKATYFPAENENANQ